MKPRWKQGQAIGGTDWQVERHGASIILRRSVDSDTITPSWFRDRHWRQRSLVVGEEPGRGAVLFVSRGAHEWALRHYRRGGAVARLTADRYLWTGLERTRAFRECRLLGELHAGGLPVPNPVAAHVSRSGFGYRGDIITERIANTRSLSAAVTADEVDEQVWETVGVTLRRFHDWGADHADLNAHNVLLDRRARVFLVDFDRGARRAGGGWKQGNLNRLHRSLRKISRQAGVTFADAAWRRLLRGYRGNRSRA